MKAIETEGFKSSIKANTSKEALTTCDYIQVIDGKFLSRLEISQGYFDFTRVCEKLILKINETKLRYNVNFTRFAMLAEFVNRAVIADSTFSSY